VLTQGQSSGKYQRLISDIYLNIRVLHSTSITNDPQEKNLLSEAFRLNDIQFYHLINLFELFLSLSSTLSLWCSYNLQVHLFIGCPHYITHKTTHVSILHHMSETHDS